jgi:leucine dehydrogenase
MIAGWDGVAVVVRRHAPTDAWMFVAMHDDTLGRPVGGCRMTVYPRPADGLRDAQRLAEGMTRKWATLDLPFGGGKAVLALARPLDDEGRRDLLRAFGELLETLGGAFGTGEDLGTTPEDMAFLSSVTAHVVGLPEPGQGPSDPGPFTALGVMAGMRAALDHAFRDPRLDGRRILVQGVGDVGAPLARALAEAGAELLLADVDERRCRALATELGGRFVDPADALETSCDVLAPCAVGAILSERSIPRLRCRVVAGSANNQLERAEDAELLRARGILYAPDYVVNGGGALAFGLIALGTRDEDTLRKRISGIGTLLTEVFREARQRDVSPLRAADDRVDRVLARGPRRG